MLKYKKLTIIHFCHKIRLVIIMNKIEQGKEEKKSKLLDSAYKLFLEKGLNDTSIQDIVDKAKVAKGTFYLYFKDKYELHNNLIEKKSIELFNEAILKTNDLSNKSFDDQFIYFINYIIDKLKNDNNLITFISKNLTLGLYNNKLTNISNNLGIYDKFIDKIKENNINLKNPEVTLFMILELVSSTCFTTILKKEPLSIDEYKPYLYNTILNMLHEKN